jgi:hypothetical protein
MIKTAFILAYVVHKIWWKRTHTVRTYKKWSEMV